MDNALFGQFSTFFPIILMVVIFYFLLWRPQKKQQRERQAMLDSLKSGVKIVTAGGIYGTIVSLHDDYLIIRVAEKVEIKVTRNAVTQVLGKADRSEVKKVRKAEKKAVEAKKEEAKAEAEAAKPEGTAAEEKKTETAQNAE